VVATFCLRLALGMVAPLGMLPASIVPPRFFRVQFLVALGLLVVAGLFLAGQVGPVVWTVFGIASALALAGSIVWHTEEAPFGRALFFATSVAIIGLVVLAAQARKAENASSGRILDDLAAALLLGAATSAMLMGHSYLIAPAMSLAPLNRLLAYLAVALAVRWALACYGLWTWTRQSEGIGFDRETTLWLSARWLLGLVIPVVLTWMAWETARIRSTQSATGILYVVTIVSFLGELLSLLLVEKTGFLL
jgi:hypothetical protein